MALRTLLLTTVALTAVSVSAQADTRKQENRYVQENLVANKAAFKPTVATDKALVNAWGIAIRPAGAGGHFWVTGKDISFEYVGDVKASADEKMRTLHVDDLKYVKLPVGGDDKFATGVVFSGSAQNFVITQEVKGAEPITAPSKFLFASDGGIISAWTERKKPDGSFDRSSDALNVIDQSKQGSQFFGLAISHDYSRLYAADFGVAPAIHVYDGKFKPEAITFEMPFDDNKNGKVDAGEYAPFNVQALRTRGGNNSIFVTYAKTQACPPTAIKANQCKKGEIFAGEEDISKPGQGRVAEFSEDGRLIAILKDGDKLSAPWGIVFAPNNFGALSGKLLVANFGDGHIAAYDPQTYEFVDFLRDTKGNPVMIDKIWGLLFGNGESLGDANALYFAAGPNDEKDGIFGSLRAAPVKE